MIRRIVDSIHCRPDRTGKEESDGKRDFRNDARVAVRFTDVAGIIQCSTEKLQFFIRLDDIVQKFNLRVGEQGW